MEPRIIFDAGMKAFDWQPIMVSAALFAGGCAALVSDRFKVGATVIPKVGYFLIALAVLTGGYTSIRWRLMRSSRIEALASGRYLVVEGTVENFRPMYYDDRKEESFTISSQRFQYSDHETTPCFNRPWAHGGPIHDGVSVKISFVDSCILRIEAFPRAGGASFPIHLGMRVTPDLPSSLE